jgi:hypothetical protein
VPKVPLTQTTRAKHRPQGVRGRALDPVSSSRGSPAEIRENLGVELYSLVRLALDKFGVSPAQQERAIERARRQKTAPYVSGPLLRDTRGLCALLLEWSRDGEYVGADGKPRVLAVKGRGATFERLARRFLPKQPLTEVVAMACATAEVTTRPGGKIALLGGILVSVAKSRENLLAHAIRQIDQLLETILHNQVVHTTGNGNGWLERMVLGVISRSEFNDLMRELKPQIDDLLQRVDSAVQPRQPKTLGALKNATAVSVAVCVAREDDWERAGIDARPFVAPARQRAKSG